MELKEHTTTRTRPKHATTIAPDEAADAHSHLSPPHHTAACNICFADVMGICTIIYQASTFDHLAHFCCKRALFVTQHARTSHQNRLRWASQNGKRHQSHEWNEATSTVTNPPASPLPSPSCVRFVVLLCCFFCCCLLLFGWLPIQQSTVPGRGRPYTVRQSTLPPTHPNTTQHTGEQNSTHNKHTYRHTRWRMQMRRAGTISQPCACGVRPLPRPYYSLGGHNGASRSLTATRTLFHSLFFL